MYQYQSLCNISPRDFLVPDKLPGEKYKCFILGSVFLHLLLVSVFIFWHHSGAKYSFSGDNVIEVNFVSLPKKRNIVAIPNQKREVTAVRAVKPVLRIPPKTADIKKKVDTVPEATEKAELAPVKETREPEPVQAESKISATPAVDATANSPEENSLISNTIPMNSNHTDTEEGNITGIGDSGVSDAGSSDNIKPGISTGQQYVDNNFYYVKDLITSNLVYPMLARRMKWQGTVVVSFVVLEDGTVKNIRVVNSSGHSVLDKNVIATIEQVQPFSAPPALAEFTMPIKYVLKK